MQFPGYTELFDSFVFRKEGALTIPKSVRSKAFSMQINVEIISVAKNIYRNFASLPPYGFYGYAVLVLRNYAQIQIPLNQARQVIYYDRNDSAFAQWYSLYLAQVQTANLLAVSANQIVPIGNALGVIFTPSPTECISPPVWEELPIREVYVNTQFGTTFRIEVFHTLPVATEYGSCFYDGGSQFSDDPIKDAGLPSTGTQPQIAGDPNNPYAGFPEPSTESELGDFFNNKLDSIDEPNSEYELNDAPATSTEEGWYFESSFDALDGVTSGSTVNINLRVACLRNSVASVNLRQPTESIGFACGTRNIDFITLTITETSYSQPFNILSGTSINGAIKYGLLPDTEVSASIPDGICA